MFKVNEFQSYLKFNKGYSDHTIINYISDLNQFDKFLKSIQVTDLNTLTVEHLQKYIATNIKLNASSIHRKMSCLRTYLKFAFINKYLNQDLSMIVPRPKRSKKLPFVLNELDTLKLIPSQDDNIRDKALLEVLYSCGLRVSEVSQLNWNDVLWHNAELRVTGKGNKERIIPLLTNVLETLKKLKSNQSDNLPIFCNINGGRLSTRAIFNIVSKRASRIGLPKTVTPHTLRHSFATHLLSNGANLRTIQTLLGHSNISTTEIYTQLDQKKIKEEHLKSHPLAKNSASE